jgi:uncharacterized repeat protein (TIGR03943 family)
VRRETQHVLLLLLGGALLRIAADDTYLRYVRPSHRWLLLGAGAVMVTLAVVALARDLRGTRVGDGPDHDHPAAERHAPWLLLLPVLVIALVAPPALGADAVVRAGPSGIAVGAADVFPPLPPGDAPELPVGEFVQRALFDTGGTLTGREVTLVGFAVRRGDAVELARLTISCCAADARPSRIRLDGAGERLRGVEPDTWLRIRGTVAPGSGTQAQQYVPAVTVSRVEIVAAPPDPYEY